MKALIVRDTLLFFGSRYSTLSTWRSLCLRVGITISTVCCTRITSIGVVIRRVRGGLPEVSLLVKDAASFRALSAHAFIIHDALIPSVFQNIHKVQ